ncbi:caspase family protein [Dactylosporangium sp. AC04546]|uniref:caspase, EACC1-associated type n=1 Tax=Dactylosporangium sp. AC04546 TaxID=2862460 RepID=UPI001EDEE347|nr:caspase family protein [Dactylosporangium sp. AC04546]WVK79920.1 caspase family protein [Dactylosporangium sp. AC04546]
MALPDPRRSRAVLVGAGAYTELEPLPAVPANLHDLRALLTDPLVWGLPPSHCRVVLNPSSTDTIRDALYEAGRAATDALVFYYAGHGVVDPAGVDDLYLTTPRTTLDPMHAAVRYEDVRALIAAARCPSKVVLLDCCYSGLALAGAMGDATRIADRVSIDASYVMTATAETRLALAPPGERYTAFTGELIDVLRNGLPNTAELLDMDGIYWQVLRNLTDKQRPTPQAKARNRGHTIAIARNRGRLTADAAPPVARPPAHEPPQPGRPPAEQLRLAPAALLSLALKHPDEDAGPIVAAHATYRPTQEVAAMLGRLWPSALGAMVAGAALRRSPADVAELLSDLAEIGAEDVRGHLLGRAAARDASRVVALAVLLPAATRAVLLDAAARACIGRPAAMIGLIAALQTSDLRPEVDDFIAGLATAMPAPDAIALADALRDANHDGPAFALYAAAGDALLERPAAAVAEIAAALRRTGRDEPADRLLERLAETCADAAAAGRVLDALWAEGLAGDAGRALSRVAGRLPPAELLALADHLRFTGRAPDGLRLLHEAAASADRLVGFAVHLHAAGRPIDGNHLLAGRIDGVPDRDFADVVLAVARRVDEVAARRLLDRAGTFGPARLVALLEGLNEDLEERDGRADGPDRVGERLLAHLERLAYGGLPLPVEAAALVALVRRRHEGPAERLLRATRPQWFDRPAAAVQAFTVAGREAEQLAAHAQLLIAFATVRAVPTADELTHAFLSGGETGHETGHRHGRAAGGEAARAALVVELGTAGPVVAGNLVARLAGSTADGLAAAVFAAIPALPVAGLLAFYQILARGLPDRRAEYAELVARRAAPAGVRAMLDAVGHDDAVLMVRSVLPAGRDLPYDEPAAARLVQVAAWLLRNVRHHGTVLPWLTGSPSTVAGVAAGLVVARDSRWHWGSPDPPSDDDVRQRLRTAPGEQVVQAYWLDGPGLLAFTDRAVRHAWRHGRSEAQPTHLTYDEVVRCSFDTLGGDQLIINRPDGTQLRWRTQAVVRAQTRGRHHSYLDADELARILRRIAQLTAEAVRE